MVLMQLAPLPFHGIRWMRLQGDTQQVGAQLDATMGGIDFDASDARKSCYRSNLSLDVIRGTRDFLGMLAIPIRGITLVHDESDLYTLLLQQRREGVASGAIRQHQGSSPRHEILFKNKPHDSVGQDDIWLVISFK